MVWPKPANGSSEYTPSPIMDVLSSTTTELADARARLTAAALIKEDKQQKKTATTQIRLVLRIELAISAHHIHQDPRPIFHPVQPMKSWSSS